MSTDMNIPVYDTDTGFHGFVTHIDGQTATVFSPVREERFETGTYEQNVSNLVLKGLMTNPEYKPLVDAQIPDDSTDETKSWWEWLTGN